jgi:alkanesulfonate monooxygenase SsuD/methylene tetrahydromethanopterin reductase-like flavin-dependent oxidoreductase (luciferase family)
MRFGIFGGAKTTRTSERHEAIGGLSGDSISLNKYIDYVLLAEDLGFSHVFMVEHHFTGGGQVSSSLGLLIYLAARTRRIRLGTAVIVLPWHNPAILAETVATLDVLSGGRFDFGIGKGYRPVEFAGFCIPQAEAGERFNETLAFLRTAWTREDRFSHHGRFWNFENVTIEPRVIQRPHPPLWMAGNSADSIRRAAHEGVNLLLDQVSPIAGVAERVALYRTERAAARADFKPGQIAVTRGLHLVANEREREEAVSLYARVLNEAGALVWLNGRNTEENVERYRGSDAPLIGTPQQIIGQLQALEAAGVETVLFADISGSHETLRTFARDIMPAFSRTLAAT